MASAWMRGGPYDDNDTIREYERQFAECCGVNHAVSFGAGRMALFAILEVLGIGAGDEVIIPAFTCVVVPNAILYRGARPVYVDIEPQFFNIDVTKVERAITPRTKALYAQHTFGIPCDVDALRELGRRHGLPVIEDAAHALGAVYRDRPIGSLTEVAFVSTDHSKVINTHLGGMALTNDEEYATRLRQVQAATPFLDQRTTRRLIRSFLIEYLCFSPKVLWVGRTIHAILARTGFLFYFVDELMTTKPTAYPYPNRLSSAQARMGLSQLRNLKCNRKHRQQIAEWLEQVIGWNRMAPDELNDATWLRYSFLVQERTEFESKLADRFDLGIWFTSVASGRETELELVGYAAGSCPVAEDAARHIVNLPTHLRIPLKAIQREVNRHWPAIKANLRRPDL